MSAVPASDEGDDDIEVSPCTSPCLSNGRHKHRRKVVDRDKDEDEWVKKTHEDPGRNWGEED